MRAASTGAALQIGPFAFCCSSGAPDLLENLARRYAAFPLHELSSQTVALNVTLSGNLRAPDAPEPALDWSEQRLTFSAPGYQGVLEANGQARLTLSSANPLGEVDFFLRAALGVLALQRGGLLFHCAGIVRGGRAYLFFGASGSGKTTAARLSAPLVVLNDDLVLITPIFSGVTPSILGVTPENMGASPGWQAWATPFWNPSQVAPGVGQAPLAGLYRLVQDRAVFCAPLKPAAALAELLSSLPLLAVLPGLAARAMQTCLSLVQTTPVYSLHFRPEPSFWEVLPEQ